VTYARDHLIPLVGEGQGNSAYRADPPDRAQDAPAGTVVMCGHSERAMTAASLLQRAGRRGLAVLAGGAGDGAAAAGRPLREGL
jgi:hydroxyacylglutathione hydrolase